MTPSSLAAASVACLLLPLLACGSDPVPTPVEPRQGPPLVVLLDVDEKPRSEIASARLSITGFPADRLEGDMPPKDVRPVWEQHTELRDPVWPVTVEVRPPAGVVLLVMRDADGDGSIGPGDRTSGPVPVGPEQDGTRIQVVMDRWLGIVAGGPTGNLAIEEREVVVERAEEAAHLDPRPVIILGYPPGSLPGGDPPPGVPPAWNWSGSDPDGAWPLGMLVPLPAGLDLVVVIDVDADGEPGPADWSNRVVPGMAMPAPGQPLHIEIARRFVPTGTDLPEPLETPAPAELAADDDSSEPPVVDEAARIDAARLHQTKLVLESRPRVPFMRQGVVMVAGYRPADIDHGMPRPDAGPIWFWRSDELELLWPLRVEAPLPQGATVYLILDLDDDGRPSPGDLSSGPAVDWAPPLAGAEASFVFERAFGLADTAR